MEIAEETPTILVADDDIEQRKILRAMLTPIGVNMLEARDGNEALTILANERVDVVVSDLVMPRMSGLMLLHSMLEKGMHTPFVLLSGFSDKDSAIQALRLGAFDYLEKPVHESDLRPVLIEALKLSKQQQLWLSAVAARDQRNNLEQPDKLAEIQIMRMRVVRPITEDAASSPAGHENNKTWRDLKDLFIREAQALLAFSGLTLRDLKTSATTQDLTVALRVFQSIRMGAESMRFSDLAAFTWSLEAAISGFRRRPQKLTKEHINLMLEANNLIIKKVDMLGDPDARRIQDSLVTLAAETEGDPRLAPTG